MSILKNLDVPVFYAEGVPRGVTKDNYRLEVSGLIDNAPLVFSLAQLEAMPFTSVNARLTSVSGWSVRADWQGLRFTDFLTHVKLAPGATHANFGSFNRYTTCVPLEELTQEKVLICYKVGGEDLELDYGGPVRMFIPQLWGYKSIKGLSWMKFTDRSIPGYWETRGYPDRAEITPGYTLDVNTRTRKRISGGEVTEF
jgi:DMSO/TMAO reductase YedYZ molybdopterin-dependent catalytic subunit